MSNEWVTPLINTVITPFLVVMVTLLTWMVNEWRKDYAVIKVKAEKAVALENENATLKRDNAELVQDHADEIIRVKERYRVELDEKVDEAVKLAVDAAVKPLKDEIKNLQDSNANLSKRLSKYETGDLDPSKVPDSQP